MRQKSAAEIKGHAYGASRRMSGAVWVTGLLLLSTLLLAAAACDGGPTEARTDTFTVGPSPRLVVNSVNGRVVVNVAPDNTVQIRAMLKKADRVDYQVSQDGGTVSVEAKKKGGFLSWIGRSPGADLEITAPPTTRLELRTSNGRIELHGMQGSGTLRTSNGEIVLEDAKGEFDVSTSNGSIDVRALEGSATLHTSNGRVTVREAAGAFDIETSNGSIDFTGQMTPGGSNKMETSNGSVSIRLEGTPSLKVDASTSNGAVITTLPILTTSTGDEGRLVGAIGEGEATLVIRTSNGSVRIQ